MKRHIYGTIPYLYLRLFRPSSDEINYRRYFMKHGYTRHPYPHAEKYMNMKIDLFMDDTKGMHYVMHTGNKKLYFPRHFTEQKIKALYKSLVIEQDKESSHSYVDSIQEMNNKTLLDIGAAEGLIALNAIEGVKSVYLFEYDERWIEPLEATFEPYKEKVRIIKKFVSNKVDDTSVTLDSFCRDMHNEPLFIKMDIEGEECNALEGAKELFELGRHLDFAICTYHKKHDLRDISSFLDKYNCSYFPRMGLFFVKHSFRKGLVRGKNYV